MIIELSPQAQTPEHWRDDGLQLDGDLEIIHTCKGREKDFEEFLHVYP